MLIVFYFRTGIIAPDVEHKLDIQRFSEQGGNRYEE